MYEYTTVLYSEYCTVLYSLHCVLYCTVHTRMRIYQYFYLLYSLVSLHFNLSSRICDQHPDTGYRLPSAESNIQHFIEAFHEYVDLLVLVLVLATLNTSTVYRLSNLHYSTVRVQYKYTRQQAIHLSFEVYLYQIPNNVLNLLLLLLFCYSC